MRRDGQESWELSNSSNSGTDAQIPSCQFELDFRTRLTFGWHSFYWTRTYRIRGSVRLSGSSEKLKTGLDPYMLVINGCLDCLTYLTKCYALLAMTNLKKCSLYCLEWKINLCYIKKGRNESATSLWCKELKSGDYYWKRRNKNCSNYSFGAD